MGSIAALQNVTTIQIVSNSLLHPTRPSANKLPIVSADIPASGWIVAHSSVCQTGDLIRVIEHSPTKRKVGGRKRGKALCGICTLVDFGRI